MINVYELMSCVWSKGWRSYYTLEWDGYETRAVA